MGIKKISRIENGEGNKKEGSGEGTAVRGGIRFRIPRAFKTITMVERHASGWKKKGQGKRKREERPGAKII